jgi:two-component system sensor histidine kinase UhpB
VSQTRETHPLDGLTWSGWVLAAGVYGLAWLALESQSYELWFLPAGWRLAWLWIAPTRRWILLAGAEWLVLTLRALAAGAPAVGSGEFLGLNVYPWLAYALAVLLLRGRQASPLVFSPGQAIRLLLAGVLSAAAVSPVLGHYFPLPQTANQGSISQALAFLYGDVLGQLMVAPPVLVALQAWSGRGRLERPFVRHAAVMGLGVAALLLGTYVRPELTPYLMLLVFLPLYVMAFRHGFEGAALATSALGFGLQLVREQQGLGTDVVTLQLMMAVIGSGALVLGAASTALALNRQALTAQHHALAEANRELAETAQDLRSVSQRMVRLEEQGQRELANDLDADISQAIHSLATSISLAFKDAQEPRTLRWLESLRAQVRDLQDSLRRSLRQLRPMALDSHGLRYALEIGPPRDILDDAGVRYECRFFGAIERLDEDDSTVVYRITQAAVREAVRQEMVRAVLLDLELGPELEGSASLSLRLQLVYSAGEFRPAENPPLDAITDRMLAHQGEYRVESDALSARHVVSFRARLRPA